jgi:hypothetical protein
VTPLAATLGPTAYWYLTRATGVVSLLLLTGVIVLGIRGPMRLPASPRWPRFALDTLHRDLSLLAVALIVVHVVAAVLDGFAPISLVDGLIPLHSSYRPLWLGFGALAFDLMLALIITSLIRRRLGYRAWRAVHWLAYASWPVAVLHGLGTGSDTKQVWSLALTFACLLVVSAAVIGRVGRTPELAAEWRNGAIGAAVVTPLAVAVFTVLGPLAPHWSSRSGTPPSLLAATAGAAVSSPARHAPATTTTAAGTSHPLKLPFSAQLRGSITQTTAGGGAILDIELRVSGGLTGALRIRLGGQPIGGGLSMTGSQVDLLASGLPAALEGQVTQLNGSQLTAHVTAAKQRSVNLTAVLQIDNQTGSVSGRLQGQAA